MESATTSPSALANITLKTRQVHTFTDRFAMANTYLIEGEAPVVVDPSSALHVQLLCDYLERTLQRSSSEIKLIVLTHLHLDHTTGLDALLRRCNAAIAASKVVRDLIQKGYEATPCMLNQLEFFLPAYERQLCYITTWLEDVQGLPVDPDWRVIASPGHTPDSLCLYNPFTAELLSGNTVITAERSRPVARGRTSMCLLEETLVTLRSLRIHFLYPAHGWPILARDPLKNIRIER